MNDVLRRTILGAIAGAVVGLAAGACNAESTSGGEAGLSTSLTVEQTTGSPAAAPGEVQAVYRIDAGDNVSITVYGEPDLSIEAVQVKSDGRISLPLIGDLDARGLTARELEARVTSALANGYLRNPSVTVNIEKYRLFYIKGEVRQPGGYNYVEGLTVEKAVALAGGYTERASERALTLVRETDPDRRAVPARPETRVEPGDVVTIGESFF